MKSKASKSEHGKKDRKKGTESSDTSIAETPAEEQKPVPAVPVQSGLSDEEREALKVQIQERDDEIAKLKEQLHATSTGQVSTPNQAASVTPSAPLSARGKASKSKADKNDKADKTKKGKKKGEASEASDTLRPQRHRRLLLRTFSKHPYRQSPSKSWMLMKFLRPARL